MEDREEEEEEEEEEEGEEEEEEVTDVKMMSDGAGHRGSVKGRLGGEGEKSDTGK